MQNLKNGKNELVNKTELQIQKKKLWLWGKKGEVINWKIEIDVYTPLYIKQIINMDLL